MALRPSCVPLRIPLLAPPESSLLEVPDPASDCARAASPTVSRFLATAVTDHSIESAAASALVAELLDFAAPCRLDYATALVAESVSASPPSVGGESALCTDVLEDRQEEFECLAVAVPRFASMLLAPEGDSNAPDIPTPHSYAEAITGPYPSQWQAAMDAEMASWKSTGTYVDEVPPSRANMVDGMWIFRVKWPPGSPLAFKARYVARGFSQRQGVDYFHTFSPTPKMSILWVLLHVAAQRDYELHSLDFSTAFLQGSLHEEIWLRRPPGFTGTFLAGTQWSLRRPVYGLRQAPREWHDTLRTTLAALGFAPSTADPSLFLRTDPSLPPFTSSCTRDTPALTWVLQRFGFQFSSPQPTPLSTSHSLSAPPSDESIEPSGPYPELVGCLMYLMTCTRPDLAYPLSLLARYVASVHRAWGLCLDDGVQLFSLVTQAPPGSSCEAEIYARAMAAQELRWLTYLLTNMGEPPCLPPVLTKHIALRYFLARELQQRGQLRLTYVATRANTALFTKALPPVRPSTAPQRVPLPSPPASSLPDGPDPESDSLRAASPSVTRFLATTVTDPLFESSAASALVAELVDFAAACRLDYAASLVAESVSASVCPPSVGGECVLGTDVLEDRQEDLECFAASSPHLVSMLLAPEGDPDALDVKQENRNG
ncbi:unnamed protein product [Closterium sp. NIES-53]